MVLNTAKQWQRQNPQARLLAHKRHIPHISSSRVSYVVSIASILQSYF